MLKASPALPCGEARRVGGDGEGGAQNDAPKRQRQTSGRWGRAGMGLEEKVTNTKEKDRDMQMPGWSKENAFP